MIAADLWSAYRKTSFEATVNGRKLTLRIGRRCLRLDALLRHHGERCAAFITAYNPGSKRSPLARNRSRQRRLGAAIKRLGHPCYKGRGIGEDATWIEPSFLVIGLPRAQAIALGLRFRQNAIVAANLRRPVELVFCPR